MASDDNVVKMPDRLERRAQKIEAAMTRRAKGDEEWIEGTLDLAVELAGARDDHNGDREFGRWLDGRFGDNRLLKDERSILIQWGKDLSQTRLMLEGAESRSIQVIHRSFRSVTKGRDEPPSKPSGGPKLQQAKDKILAYEATTGKLPPADRHFEMPGITPSTYDRAIREVRSVRTQAEALGPLKFTKAQDSHVEAQLRLLDKEREKEFDARVTKETKARIDLLFPGLEKLREDAKRNEKYYREQIEKQAIFTEAEYRDLLLCTHEANPSEETRKRAFIALNAKKLRLTGKP